MPSMCWLHPDREEHPVALLEGWRLDTGVVIPADLRCAREQGPDQEYRRVPATEITVGSVTS